MGVLMVTCKLAVRGLFVGCFLCWLCLNFGIWDCYDCGCFVGLVVVIGC